MMPSLPCPHCHGTGRTPLPDVPFTETVEQNGMFRSGAPRLRITQEWQYPDGVKVIDSRVTRQHHLARVRARMAANRARHAERHYREASARDGTAFPIRMKRTNLP